MGESAHDLFVRAVFCFWCASMQYKQYLVCRCVYNL